MPNRYKVVLSETQTKLAIVWAETKQDAVEAAKRGEGDHYPDAHPFRELVDAVEFPLETC